MRVVARIDRMNAAVPWSHNDWYGPWVVRQMPAGARRALDVGCGAGVVGCCRQAGWCDRLVDLLAIPANLAVGLLRRRQAAAARLAMSAPVAAPTDTLADIHRAAAATLGTYRLRRRLFWRYTLTHTRY